jgi:murein DD-endopeptidase MepM/ murein hydrolase activator NlpD
MSRVKYASLVVLLCCCIAPLYAEAQPFMDWPMGESIDSVPVMGYKANIRRRFAAKAPDWVDGREHTGIDLFWDDPSVSTAGAPVYAAISGIVDCLPGTLFTHGTVVVLRHRDVWGGTFYSMYGHVEPKPWLQVGQVVNRGELIAQVAANPEDPLNAHLHFELRNWLNFSGTGNCMGPGYAPADQTAVSNGWWDPVDFYYNHRSFAYNAIAYVDTIFSVRAQPRKSATALVADNPAGSPLFVMGVLSNPHTEDNINGTEWWYVTHHYDSVVGLVMAYVVGARPVPEEGHPGTFLSVGEVRHLDNTSQCMWGADRYGRSIAPSVTYRGYHVCGADGFAYECTSNGWAFTSAACVSPPAAQCGTMNDGYGSTDPAETYIGMRVCGLDSLIRECTDSGWSNLETPCD